MTAGERKAERDLRVARLRAQRARERSARAFRRAMRGRGVVRWVVDDDPIFYLIDHPIRVRKMHVVRFDGSWWDRTENRPTGKAFASERAARAEALRRAKAQLQRVRAAVSRCEAEVAAFSKKVAR